MEIHVLDIPNSKMSVDMHNMIISHLICEVNGKAMPTLPSKTHKQIMLLINICLWILLVAICQDFYFYVKKLNGIKQEIQKSTYFVVHSHQTQKVMSTFFIPCFVGAFGCVAIAAPPEITACRDSASGDRVSSQL